MKVHKILKTDLGKFSTVMNIELSAPKKHSHFQIWKKVF